MGFFIVLTIQLAIQVNIGLGVFNLVPLPPLDGSKILMHFYHIMQKHGSKTTKILSI